jgi:hypothetical protein
MLAQSKIYVKLIPQLQLEAEADPTETTTEQSFRVGRLS